MKLPASRFTLIDWSEVPVTDHPAASGTSTWRTQEVGDLRLRIVEYSPGHLADHWCERGHLVHVLEGTLISELQDGRTFTLTAGMTYRVSDGGDSPHRSKTTTGAKLLIVD